MVRQKKNKQKIDVRVTKEVKNYEMQRQDNCMEFTY